MSNQNCACIPKVIVAGQVFLRGIGREGAHVGRVSRGVAQSFIGYREVRDWMGYLGLRGSHQGGCAYLSKLSHGLHIQSAVEGF
jgi:hypothetical protein